MGKNIYDQITADNILARNRSLDDAAIFEGNTQSPFEVQKVVLDLSTGNDGTSGAGNNPYKLSFPFKSVYVQDATDYLTQVSLYPNTQDTIQSGVPLAIKDVLVFDTPQSKSFLKWPAQSGKTMTLFFLVSGKFQSGSFLSIIGGGVAIVEGSAMTHGPVALTTATATVIFSQNSGAKVRTIQNTTGASIWVGGSTVSNAGANIGIEVLPGAIFQWRNTAALYGYSVAGGNITQMTES